MAQFRGMHACLAQFWIQRLLWESYDASVCSIKRALLHQAMRTKRCLDRLTAIMYAYVCIIDRIIAMTSY